MTGIENKLTFEEGKIDANIQRKFPNISQILKNFDVKIGSFRGIYVSGKPAMQYPIIHNQINQEVGYFQEIYNNNYNRVIMKSVEVDPSVIGVCCDEEKIKLECNNDGRRIDKYEEVIDFP